MTKSALQEHYTSLGGIHRVFEAYKAGEISMREVSKKINLSTTSINNHLRSVFGEDKVNAARALRRKEVAKETSVRNVNAGRSTHLSYVDAVAYLQKGEIKRLGFLTAFETTIALCRPIIGNATWVQFGKGCVSCIGGEKGRVRVRYAIPSNDSAEYKIGFYRFKIRREESGVKAVLFCLKVSSHTSYYLFPVQKLAKVQSLNLKFSDYDRSKYSQFLVKVED